MGYHLTGVRQVPAALEARGWVAASSRRRGVPHTGAAPLPLADQHRGATAAGLAMVGRDGVRAPCLAMAPRHARNARAMATTTWWALFPLARSCLSRLHRRLWAFPRISWRGLAPFSRRRGQCRRTLAGSRSAPAPSPRARRAGLWPVVGRPPGRRRAPVASAAGVTPRECMSGLG